MSADAWLVWVIPLVGALFVPMVERLRRSWCRWYAIVVSAASALFSIHQAATFSAPYVGTLWGWSLYQGVQAEVYVDGLSVLLAVFVSVLSLVILVYAAGNMEREQGQARFYALMLVFIGAMMGLVMAGNLLQFYLLWEVLGICSALLIAFWWDREPARKAGLKAFLVTRIGDVALLIAVIVIYTGLHTTDISSVLSSINSPGSGVNWTLVGVLLLIGSMGKSAQVPLHVWLPDAMEGPTPVSALIHAATMVNAGVYLLVRLSPLFAAPATLSGPVLGVGLVSLFVGGACAAAATDIKRVLAYSTISQLGLMFAAVGLGSPAGALYQLIGQGVFKALAFMSAGSVVEATGTREMPMLGGLAGRMKITYVAFLASSVAMAGFPPFFGFWTKEFIAASALSYGTWAFLTLVLGSALTSFYMFRALFRVFHGKVGTEGAESGRLTLAPMVLLSLGAVAGWLLLTSEGVFAPPLGTTMSLAAAAVSVAAISLALVLAFFFFVSRSTLEQRLVSGGSAMGRLTNSLKAGLGFDAAYSALVQRGFYPLARSALKIQTGDLGRNVLLLLVALVAILLLSVLVAL